MDLISLSRIESSKNFSINTRDYEGRLDNRLFLGHDKLEVLAHHFRVVDTHGAMLFSVNKNEVSIGANALNVEGEGGAIFRESIQAPVIRAEPGKELKYVSNLIFSQQNSSTLTNSMTNQIDHCVLISVNLFKRLESPTRSLLINAGKDISIKSGAGNIDANCLNDIRIQSTEGSVSTSSKLSVFNNLINIYHI